MSARRLPPPWDEYVARRKGVIYVPAAEGSPTRLNGRRERPAIHDLPAATEERGRRTAALLAAAERVL